MAATTFKQYGEYRIVPLGDGQCQVFGIYNCNNIKVRAMQTVEGAEAYAALLESGHYKE